mmetsp:Transcript_45674/g.67905  ORF Transcript_45674/g.67905 Transcript_45674/m.67905 type:complete len:92 (-) Transcript_45674:804-1079(-)
MLANSSLVDRCSVGAFGTAAAHTISLDTASGYDSILNEQEGVVEIRECRCDRYHLYESMLLHFEESTAWQLTGAFSAPNQYKTLFRPMKGR